MSIPIKEQIIFIKTVRAKYGLSAERICDVVAESGSYLSVHSVRRIIAKGAEERSWRAQTVEPVYEALNAIYGDDQPLQPAHTAPSYTREKYEKVLALLHEAIEDEREKNRQAQETIEKQAKMIDVLWHGLKTFGEGEETYKKILDYYLKG